jgi:hypothetical protein
MVSPYLTLVYYITGMANLKIIFPDYKICTSVSKWWSLKMKMRRCIRAQPHDIVIQATDGA